MIAPVFENIPDELKARPQWVLWRYEHRDGKPTKIPYDARSRRRASTTAETWATYAEAVAAFHVGGCDGIGFVFAADDPFCGIDLDDCRDPEFGQVLPWAQKIIDDFGTYCEVSPSGTGFKLFGRGTIPGARKRTGSVEMYDSGRYFTVTGHRHGDVAEVTDVRTPLDALYRELFDAPDGGDGKGRAAAHAPATASDAEILETARKAGGDWFAALYDRGEGYDDDSKADFALCAALAVAGADAAAIDRLYRASGLMREKWDRADYRERTIRNAAEAAGKRQAKKPPASRVDPVPAAQAMIDAEYRDGGTLALRFFGGEFYRWRDGRYSTVGMDEMKAAVTRRLDLSHSGVKGAVVANVIEGLKAETIIEGRYPDAALPCWLGEGERRPKRVAVGNGVLEIEAAVAGRPDALRPPSPEWFSTVRLPYPYGPAAECPKWLAAVGRNVGGDESLTAVLQEWFGYCLLPTTDYQKFLMLHGEGGTGKSSTLAALVALLGRENVSAVPLEQFGSNFALYATLGKLANVAAEIGDIDKAAEGHLKSLTSGDPMQFDRKYLPPVTAVPTARLVFSTNNLPRFKDRSGGLWRRMLLVPFDRVIPPAERTPGMDKPEWWEAAGELPGILNWAVAGLRRLRERGRFTDSERSEAAKAEYRADSNPAGLFLAEHCRAEPNGELPRAALYTHYKGWCIEGNYRPLSEGPFGKEVRRAFPGVSDVHPRVNGKQVHAYAGITLADVPPTPPFLGEY